MSLLPSAIRFGLKYATRYGKTVTIVMQRGYTGGYMARKAARIAQGGSLIGSSIKYFMDADDSPGNVFQGSFSKTKRY